MMTDLCPSPRQLFAYEPPVSLWGLVTNNVSQHEWEEVKNILGASVVEQSLELHEEVNTLLEIWQDYRDETQETLVTGPQTLLPEPPGRERLKQEIRFFIESLREKAKENGRDPGTCITKYNSEVIDYVLDEKRPGSSGYSSMPSTARSSRDGRETPMMRVTPTSDRASMSSRLDDDVETMTEKLNYLQMDEVVQHLRETLEEEVEQLLKDIAFLQSCLDDEASFRVQSSTLEREPSLHEMRAQRSKLEKDLLTKETSIPAALRDNIKSSPQLKPEPTSVSGKNLRPSRPTTGQTATSRQSPVKASHKISTQVLKLPEDGRTRGCSHHQHHAEGSQAKVTSNASVNHQPEGGRRASKSRTSSASSTSSSSSTIDSAHWGRYTPSSPSHIFLRTGSRPGSGTSRPGSGTSAKPDIRLVAQNANTAAVVIPTPPSSAKPVSGRPNSASRFRKLVLDCRDGT